MKKKKNITIMLLSGVSIVLICCLAMKEWVKQVKLTDGFQEINIQERERYTETPNNTSLEINNSDLKSISVEEGKLKIKLAKEEIEKTIPEESITSILSDSSCLRTLRSYLYVLTDKKNVYKSELLVQENTYKFLKENVQKEWKKVFDGTQLKENDTISFLSLKSDSEFTTCATFDVYLKINDKVMDFSKTPYIEAIRTRTIEITEGGILKYNYDGTIEIETNDGKIQKVQNNEGKEIKALFIGSLNGSQDYILDEEGNEYHLKKDLWTDFVENNGVLEIAKKNQILKIGKQDYNYETKGYRYEVIFKNKEKKQIIVEAGHSVFEEIN